MRCDVFFLAVAVWNQSPHIALDSLRDLIVAGQLRSGGSVRQVDGHLTCWPL